MKFMSPQHVNCPAGHHGIKVVGVNSLSFLVENHLEFISPKNVDYCPVTGQEYVTLVLGYG